MSGPACTYVHRYFQIDFDACGTTALAHFFQRNGMPAVHYDGGKLARQIDANLREGRYILHGYERFQVFTDMVYMRPHVYIEAYKYYRQIMAQVPGAKFILNTRDRERWVASRLRICGGEFDTVKMDRAFYGLNDLRDVVTRWRRDWDRHHAAVRQAIPADRLLIFDIESDSPFRLCRFAGLSESAAKHWRRQNGSLNPYGKFIGALIPLSVKRRIPKAVKEPVKRLFWVTQAKPRNPKSNLITTALRQAPRAGNDDLRDRRLPLRRAVVRRETSRVKPAPPPPARRSSGPGHARRRARGRGRAPRRLHRRRGAEVGEHDMTRTTPTGTNS